MVRSVNKGAMDQQTASAGEHGYPASTRLATAGRHRLPIPYFRCDINGLGAKSFEEIEDFR
jgi:hypothetical protein